MVDKKKSNIYLKKYISLFVIVFFCMGFNVFGNTCYALTSFDEFDSGDMYNVLDYFSNLLDNSPLLSSQFSTLKSKFTIVKNDNSRLEIFTDKFKTSVYNTLGQYLYNDLYCENLFFTLGDNGRFYCGLSNNTIGVNFEHIEVMFNRLNGSYPQYDIYNIDDNHNLVNTYRFWLSFQDDPQYDGVYGYNNQSTYATYLFSDYIIKDDNTNIAYYPFLRIFWI